MDNKQQNFKRIAENRTNKIITMIRSLENLTNTSYYEYTDEQIDTMMNAIQEALDGTRKAFDDKKNKQKRFEL